MKILHTVEFYSPSVGGMQEVVKQLSERLVMLGHNVTVATTRLSERTEKVINGVEVEDFSISGNAVGGLSGEVGRYQSFLIESDFDVITNFAAQQWATDAMLPILDRIKAKTVLVPTGFSGLYRPEYKAYFESLRPLMGIYDMNIFLSENYRDINFAREAGVKKIVVIPNGAAEDEFAREARTDIRHSLSIHRDHFLLLSVGSHTGLKGHAEAISIFSKARIKHATFLLVANPSHDGCEAQCRRAASFYNFGLSSKLRDKRIIVVNLPRAETVAAYHAADLFLFTSRVECSPLVLFEAMASHTPFLTTDVGNSREIIEWSGGGKLLPTDVIEEGYVRARIEESAAALEETVRSESTRRNMADHGHSAWKEKFTWASIARKYEKLYEQLMRDKP